MTADTYLVESFSDAERRILEHFFTNTDKPVFGLINLPEVVKGALFARYSRTPKSLRRLFLDEFVNREEIAIPAMVEWAFRHSDKERTDEQAAKFTEVAGETWKVDKAAFIEPIAEVLQFGGESFFSTAHAEGLYRRVFDEYGDDSVAQLGGAHLACEQMSNVLIKEQLEWGRLAAYLEQSTRYIDYSDKLPNGRFRYYHDPDILAGQHGKHYQTEMNWLFGVYGQFVEAARAYFTAKHPREKLDADSVEKNGRPLTNLEYKNTINAKAYDTVRGLLPAGVVSNLGIFGTGQSYENMLYRMLASDLPESREIAQMILGELRHPDMLPSFMSRVDDPEKGLPRVQYLVDTLARTREVAEYVPMLDAHGSRDDYDYGTASRRPVEMVAHSTDGELAVAAAIVYEHNRANWSLERCCRSVLAQDRTAQLIEAYTGERKNRRWKPGRAFEESVYTFDIISDFGIFRDLHRHRMLTIEWVRLNPYLGYAVSPYIEDMGLRGQFGEAMGRMAVLYELLVGEYPAAAQYVIPLAYNLQFRMTANARALMHMLELRTIPQGHPTYRRVCQEMHRQIKAVHPAIAAAMSFVDYNEYDLERLDAEQRITDKRAKSGAVRE